MSLPKEFDEGQVVRITAKFYNTSNVLTDPTTIRIRVKNPVGAEVVNSTSAWTRDSQGIYHYDVPLATNGRWYFRWEGSGDVQAVAEDVLIARRSRFV